MEFSRDRIPLQLPSLNKGTSVLHVARNKISSRSYISPEFFNQAAIDEADERSRQYKPMIVEAAE